MYFSSQQRTAKGKRIVRRALFIGMVATRLRVLLITLLKYLWQPNPYERTAPSAPRLPGSCRVYTKTKDDLKRTRPYFKNPKVPTPVLSFGDIFESMDQYARGGISPNPFPGTLGACWELFSARAMPHTAIFKQNMLKSH